MASPGIPKSIQIRFFFVSKSVSQEPPFCQFLLPPHFSWFFWSILAIFSIKNQCFFLSRFWRCLSFFFNMPTLTKVCKNQYETDFFTFCAFCFFRQKRPKNHPKFQCQKKLGKRPHLAPKIHWKSSDFRLFGNKNCSGASKKVIFWGVVFCLFFWCFFFLIFCQFWVPKWPPRQEGLSDFWAPFFVFFRFFRRKMFFSISFVFLARFGPVLDTKSTKNVDKTVQSWSHTWSKKKESRQG